MTVRCVSMAAALVCASGALAQTDTLYVTDGDSDRLAIVQGGVVQAIKTTHDGGYPIAVTNNVWIGRYYAGPSSVQYDLAGNPTGNTGVGSDVDAVDGTTDGSQFTYQFGQAFGNNGIVYRSDLDFSNPVQLFTVPNMSRAVGIAWDPTDGTLWVSGNTEVRHYSLGGTLLGGFNHNSGDGTLAYEPSTDTLWHVRSGITQYSKAGTLLQTINPGGLAANNWGAEFAIPAPGVAALLGLGGVFAGRRRR